MIEEQFQIHDIADELIILPKAVIDAFLKKENTADLIALYTFYYYTAKWQKTNQPKCTISYAAVGLKWGEAKVRSTKKCLVDIGLIKDIVRVDEKTHKVQGHYVKVSFIYKADTVEENVKIEAKSHPIGLPQGGNSHGVDDRYPNALSSGNLNALINNKQHTPRVKNARKESELISHYKKEYLRIYKNDMIYIMQKHEYINFAKLENAYGIDVMKKAVTVYFENKWYKDNGGHTVGAFIKGIERFISNEAPKKKELTLEEYRAQNGIKASV